jgi:glycosyltransferase involved in cell wall biosynthesis
MTNTVICVVLVRNEAWVLENFIKCATPWADIIIIGDHNSTDESAQIARKYDHVKLVPIPHSAFDEGVRRKAVIDEARKVPGDRLILALDADEMISANWAQSPEWQLMLHAPPGTSFYFDLIEPLPGLQEVTKYGTLAGFVDDGTEYQYTNVKIHNPRLPTTQGKTVKLTDIKLLHYIYLDPERMFSKHRWYKCVEYIEFGKRPWILCITYQDTKIKKYDAPVIRLEEEWTNGYEWLNDYREGVERPEKAYWYDAEVLKYFDCYGVGKFSKLNIWDVDWNRKAQLLGKTGNYYDPRTPSEIWVHKSVESHRETLKIKGGLSKIIRVFGKTGLRVFGW